MDRDFEFVYGQQGPLHISSQMFAEKGFIAAFTLRKGGWSPSPYDSLNMGFAVGDDAENVIRNRSGVLAGLGLDPFKACSMRQVHGIRISEVALPVEGHGGISPDGEFEQTDGLYTKLKGAALIATIADCVPVIIADEKTRSIGIVHAGWRGTAAKAAMRLSQAMGFGKGIGCGFMAAIGTSIGPCCYEIGQETAEKLEASCSSSGQAITCVGSSIRADIGMINELQLLEIGFSPERIIRYKGCTSCESDRFFSHRRDKGLTGRMAAVAAVLR